MLVSGRVSVLDGDLSPVAHLCYKKSFRNIGPRRAVTWWYSAFFLRCKEQNLDEKEHHPWKSSNPWKNDMSVDRMAHFFGCYVYIWIPALPLNLIFWHHLTSPPPSSSGPAPAIHNLTFELYSEASADFGGLRPVATTSLLRLGTWMMKKPEVRLLGLGKLG